MIATTAPVIWPIAFLVAIGEVGELVLTEPMPSMPIYFWGDADGERLRESYFSTYPGIWRHGDWISELAHRLLDRHQAVLAHPVS